MKKWICLVCALFLSTHAAYSKTPTYNQTATINLRDRGFPADERSTNILIPSGDVVYGATSGDTCHIFRFDPKSKETKILASIEGPNTVLKGMVIDGNEMYVGTMLTKRQLWLSGRKRGGIYELEDANLYQIDESWNTGRLYKITGISGDNPTIKSIGIPVQGQGIHTMALDIKRKIVYGLTYPSGRFFIYDIRSEKTETISFGTMFCKVSNNNVNFVEVIRDLTDFTPGEVEYNNKLVAKAMYVMPDGTLYTSGWDGKIIKYDPNINKPQERFTVVGHIPSVPGRQYWSRIDEIIGHNGLLYMGTSDGYIIRLDPDTGAILNYGKPVRALDVMGMTTSSLDGRIYGINGGGIDGICRFWCLDPETGAFEVDYPVFEVVTNWRALGDIVCTSDGVLVMSETTRVANLRVLSPGRPKEWRKSGKIGPYNPGKMTDSRKQVDSAELFIGHKKCDVDVFPVPSQMHSGTGYTAVQTDRSGKIYLGGASYGKYAPFMQLDRDTAQWRLIFRSDELTHRYGRGQGIPAKIHTKLRLGSDGKLYGAMKQGYETDYHTRSDIGEAPEGKRGGQYTCHFFSYDPATDTVADMGPGLSQEGIMGFHADVDRGYVYGATGPCMYFLVYDLKTGRVWNAGALGGRSPSRYMALDDQTGKAYSIGEVTPGGRHFMSVWDPEEFRLRDYEIVPYGGLKYSHPYSYCCGPVGSNTMYGEAGGMLFEMDLNTAKDGKLHVRGVCTVSVDGESQSGQMKAVALGPDNRIYWVNTYRVRSFQPIPMFAYDTASKKKTYLGTSASAGEWLYGGSNQGLCVDKNGDLILMNIFTHISPDQQKVWKTDDSFAYSHLVEQPYYVAIPEHDEHSFLSVFILKDAVSIR